MYQWGLVESWWAFLQRFPLSISEHLQRLLEVFNGGASSWNIQQNPLRRGSEHNNGYRSWSVWRISRTPPSGPQKSLAAELFQVMLRFLGDDAILEQSRARNLSRTHDLDTRTMLIGNKVDRGTNSAINANHRRCSVSSSVLAGSGERVNTYVGIHGRQGKKEA